MPHDRFNPLTNKDIISYAQDMPAFTNEMIMHMYECEHCSLHFQEIMAHVRQVFKLPEDEESG